NSLIEKDRSIRSDGKIVSDEGYGVTDFIPVKPSCQYVKTPWQHRTNLYDSNKNLIGVNEGKSIKTTNNTHFIRTAIELSLLDNIQVEQSDTATEYEPYKEDVSYIIAKKDNKIVNLRSLPNGIKDEVDLEEQKVIIKTKEFTVEKEDIKNFTTGNNRNTV